MSKKGNSSNASWISSSLVFVSKYGGPTGETKSKSDGSISTDVCAEALQIRRTIARHPELKPCTEPTGLIDC